MAQLTDSESWFVTSELYEDCYRSADQIRDRHNGKYVIQASCCIESHIYYLLKGYGPNNGRWVPEIALKRTGPDMAELVDHAIDSCSESESDEPSWSLPYQAYDTLVWSDKDFQRHEAQRRHREGRSQDRYRYRSAAKRGKIISHFVENALGLRHTDSRAKRPAKTASRAVYPTLADLRARVTWLEPESVDDSTEDASLYTPSSIDEGVYTPSSSTEGGGTQMQLPVAALEAEVPFSERVA